MAKLPGGEDISGGPSGRSGRAIASYDTSAIGRGVAQFGEGLQSAGSQLRVAAGRNAEKVDQRSGYETQRRYLEFKASQETAMQELGQKEQPGAFGFRERYQQNYLKAAKDFMATVPEPLKAEYDVRLYQAEDDLVNGEKGAGAFERTQRFNYYDKATADSLSKIENDLYADPKKLDRALADGDAFIDAMTASPISPAHQQWLSPR